MEAKMARKFKFKPAKISYEETCSELVSMGFAADGLSEVFSAAENDGGEWSDYDVEQAVADLAESRRRILQRQEDEQFEAWLAKTYPTAIAA